MFDTQTYTKSKIFSWLGEEYVHIFWNSEPGVVPQMNICIQKYFPFFPGRTFPGSLKPDVMPPFSKIPAHDV